MVEDKSTPSEPVAETQTTQEQEPVVEEPKIQPLTEEVVAKLIEAKVDEAKRHFQSVAQRQANTLKMQAEQERKERERIETEFEGWKQQYFDSLDPAEQNKLLRQQLQEVKKQSRQQIYQPISPNPERETIPVTYGDVVASLLRAQGVSDAEIKESWKVTEGIDDPMEAVQKLGVAITKLRENKLKEEIRREVGKVKKVAREEVEKEHEVGEFAPVETAGVPIGTGKSFTREQIANMPYEEYKKKEKEIDKAYREGRIK